MIQANLKKNAGSTIIVVMSVMATLMVIVAVAVEYTNTISRNVQRGDTLQSAVAIADGALESGFSYWRELCRIKTDYPVPTSWMQYIPLPTGGTTGSQFPNVKPFTATTNTYSFEYLRDTKGVPTISNFKVVAVDPQLHPLATVDTTPPPAVGMGQNSDPSKNCAVYNYLATADVALPTLKGNVVARVQRVFQKEQISPWSWAIFYVDPLEIHPGPQFNVTGWVHTNSDLFTGHKSLAFMAKATFARDWTIGWMPGDKSHLSETPVSPTYPANLKPALDIAHQPFGLDANRIFNSNDANTNNDSYHELIEPPVTGQDDPLVGKRYYDQAGVIVTINASNQISLSRRNIDPTKADVPILASSTGADLALFNMFNATGTITTNQDLQDNREGAKVRLATLDISKLITSGNFKAGGSFNGIIYLQDTSAAADGVGLKRGFRLKNGSYIPNGGLTIASPNPVYIQGDYNTGTNPPSNSGVASDADQPNATTYTRKPCSVIADAVGILSNAWNDSNLLNGMSSRIAGNTTVNTAIISGIVPSGSPTALTNAQTYSGGAENFPRFLEDWNPNTGQKTLTYYGSMVQLYKSKQSIGNWGKDNVYDAPIRQWFFDDTFKVFTPPGSLMVYSYIKGRWSLQ